MRETGRRSTNFLEWNLPPDNQMKLQRHIFTALALAIVSISSTMRSEEKPKPDRATLEAQFKKADADRAATKENTKERAAAATNAMQTASDIGWVAFDAAKFDEAATWFATSAKLKEESYLNARRYWEDYLRTTAAQLDGQGGRPDQDSTGSARDGR